MSVDLKWKNGPNDEKKSRGACEAGRDCSADEAGR